MANKAEYHIASSMNDAILEIIVTGEFTIHSLKIIEKEIFALEKETNATNELIDVRALQGRLGVADKYLFMMYVPSDRPRINTAFVDTSEYGDLKSFLESEAIKEGLSFKTFVDIDAARAWLKSLSNINQNSQ
jgi:hypothetical protein